MRDKIYVAPVPFRITWHYTIPCIFMLSVFLTAQVEAPSPRQSERWRTGGEPHVVAVADGLENGRRGNRKPVLGARHPAPEFNVRWAALQRERYSDWVLVVLEYTSSAALLLCCWPVKLNCARVTEAGGHPRFCIGSKMQ